jgi:phenylacetate-CoA ligase
LYSSLYRHVLFPLYEDVLRRRGTLKYLRLLEEAQWYPRQRLREFQLGELQKLVAHAYAQVPFYREHFDRAGLKPADIGSLEAFSGLPSIDKIPMREERERFIAHDHRGRALTKSTGGSTGMPLVFDYTRASYEWRVAMRMRGYGWAGYHMGMKTAAIWGTSVSDPSHFQRTKDNLRNMIERYRLFDSFRFNPKTMRQYAAQIRRYRPEVIVAYTHALYDFAEFIHEEGIEPPRPKSIITGSEKLYPFQRELIEAVFGCEVFDTYGCREFMLIASECERHRLHTSMENLIVEIEKDGRPARPGEVGDVVVTDLHNWGMPFIRYRNGDLAVASDDTCACGRGHVLIGDIEGRALDTLRTPDGRMIPGLFFPHLAKEYPDIRQVQVVQDHLSHMTVRIAAPAEFEKTPAFQTMKRKINKVTGDEITVDYEFVREIPLTPTGKFRVTISNLGPGDPS